MNLLAKKIVSYVGFDTFYDWLFLGTLTQIQRALLKISCQNLRMCADVHHSNNIPRFVFKSFDLNPDTNR